jgi:hypothetical protein
MVRDISSYLDASPAPFPDLAAERFDAYIRKIPMMIGVMFIGILYYFRWIRRKPFSLPSGPQFVDVSRRARLLRLWSIGWTLLRAAWISSALVAILLWLSLVASLEVPRLLAALGLSVVAWLLAYAARHLKHPYFHTGAERYLVSRGESRGWRFVGGVALRVFARAIALAAFAYYLVSVALYANGGSGGNVGQRTRAIIAAKGWGEYTAMDYLRAAALTTSDSPLTLYAVVLGVVFSAIAIDRSGMRIHARRARDVLAVDGGRHILYLRNFGDDSLRLDTTSQITNRGLLAEYNFLRRSRFEEVVVQRLNLYGPVVAVSDPRRRMPELGAAKISLPYNGWEREVERIGAEAMMVVISAAPGNSTTDCVAKLICSDARLAMRGSCLYWVRTAIRLSCGAGGSRFDRRPPNTRSLLMSRRQWVRPGLRLPFIRAAGCGRGGVPDTGMNRAM